MEAKRGTLSIGKAADFAIWDIEDIAELAYYMGDDPLLQIVKNGKAVNL
jgi:imidazolonepropionase